MAMLFTKPTNEKLVVMLQKTDEMQQLWENRGGRNLGMDVSPLLGRGYDVEKRYCDLCDIGFPSEKSHFLTKVVFPEDVVRVARQIPYDPLKKLVPVTRKLCPQCFQCFKAAQSG